ncbi:PREDICTED: high mobility group B protein 7-like [Nelumbo nucifera]|uniref:High mobility group B protein 7-like n=1 Tax=Nelumbo nucifera TaxID=4432 RepID=A0A1U7ZLZ8_NELNU|nr:PREDICTED: high mobility group B protein 7-like [Nelumbo nucifera]
MAGASSKSTPRARKRVEVEKSTLKRAKDGSAFTRCEECNKDVPVVLIDMHSCSLDSKIKMNLDAQVVERVTEVNKPTEKKRKAVSSEPKTKKSKKEKKVKDPNIPKRPPTAFFVFMEEFRKVYKEEHPDNKNVSVVSKEAGEKWKSMSDEEKKPYLDRVAGLKAEYEKAMEAYNAGKEEEQGGSEREEEEAEAEQ